MLNKISVLLSEEISLRLNSSDDEKEVYTYSMEVLLSLLLNLIILSITAHVINKELHLFIFIMFFSGLRAFAGGYHAKTHIGCISISFLMFFISAVCSTSLKQFGEIILVFGVLFSVLMVFYLAPVESENKPLSKKDRQKYKIFSRIIVVVLSLTAIFLYFVKAHTDYAYITAAMSLIFESGSLLKK